jgi:hypothetical protein
MTQPRVLNVPGRYPPLHVFEIKGQPLFDSYEVAEMLGYRQASSLRKQTLTDWKGKFTEGVHFVMVHDEQELLRWDAAMEQLFGGKRVPTKPSRGRLFFSSAGMALVLSRTSKPSAELREALTRERFFHGGITISVKDNDSMTPQLKPSDQPVPSSTLTKEERMFEYEVMQKLLEQLERLDDPQLRGLAITAAETALGRKLDDLRFGEGVKTIFEAAAPAPAPKKAAPKPRRTISEGPFFTDDDFYSMTRIGQMAGGYTAKTAGLAADVVAKRLGYSRNRIRNEQLPINQIAMRPDSSTGKKRQMVRFSRDFANKVIMELRSNPEFEATLTQGIPTLPTFGGAGGGHPLLSRGPFDEDDPTSRRS